MFLADVPDSAKANIRCKIAVAAQLPDRVLYDLLSRCAAHKLHRFIAKASGEEGIVGHIHGVMFVEQLQSRQEQLRGALHHLVEADLLNVAGEPPARFVAHTNGLETNRVAHASAH